MELAWKSFPIDLPSFMDVLKTCPNTDGIVTYDAHFLIVEANVLTNTEIETIQNYYDSLLEHDEAIKINARQQHDVYAEIILAAMNFAQQLRVEFAAENIAMGITQAGKTKLVADYLRDIQRYGGTGSLYEMIATTNELINAGVPNNLAPFVTAARLETFKQKIIDYLNG